jgi:demethylmenaquinone methyltransferase/2-methoxy-6-polyprenyl-1,4-benzoquinol methylase
LDVKTATIRPPEPSGHPEGRTTVDKSGGRVRGMFAEIAPRYDLVNRILSGGIDVRWRNVTVRRAPPPPPGGAILDVCTGTGDLALAYSAAAGPGVRVVASDFCRPMLDRGEEKAERVGRSIEWVEADAMALPFPTAAFELVTVAFGLRNIADTAVGLAEMARVCKPGGTLAILEFSLPRNPVLRHGYLWYFRHLLPAIGNALLGILAGLWLRRSAEEGLAKMDVCLDKTGKEKLATPIDRLALEGESGTSVRRDRGDAPVFDPHIGVEDSVLRVTGEEARALNQDLLCRQDFSTRAYGRSRVGARKWAPTR